jgi:sterol desaturase/sphingolipid hydroxylase (fatty acid hydroxylase superfamily)
LFSDPVSLAFFGLYFGLLAWEALRPARLLPRLSFWRARGVAALLVYFVVSSYLPYALTPLLAPFALFDLSGLGTVGGALVAFVAYEAIGYAYHRAMHASDVLFRGLHQMHHSAERLDVSSALFFSPLVMAGWTLVSSVALTLAGVSPGATVAYVLGTAFLSIFQHANIRTPRWLGYVIQRPESHSYHHARGVHAGNYSDLPLIDMLFGTFENPADFAPETGYYDGASSRLLDMLLLRDVTRPRRKEWSLSVSEVAATSTRPVVLQSGDGTGRG